MPFVTQKSRSNPERADDLDSDATSVAGVEPSGKTLLLRNLTFKKVLYHPLSWMAIGAHLLLLVVPFDPSVSTEPVPETPEEEIDDAIPVDILNLAAISTSTPPPPKPPPPKPPEATPPVAPPVAPAAPAAQPIPPAVPVEAPLDTLPAAEESSPVGGEESTQPLEPEVPAYVPDQDQQLFIGNIDALGITTYRGTAVEFPPASFFQKGNGPSFLDFADPNNPVPLASARDAVWMDEQISDVITTLQTTYGDSVNLVPVDAYAEELLYELTTADGNPFMYVSLVEFKSGSTLLVMWPSRPL